jgi:hypothetical protein
VKEDEEYQRGFEKIVVECREELAAEQGRKAPRQKKVRNRLLIATSRRACALKKSGGHPGRLRWVATDTLRSRGGLFLGVFQDKRPQSKTNSQSRDDSKQREPHGGTSSFADDARGKSDHGNAEDRKWFLGQTKIRLS